MTCVIPENIHTSPTDGSSDKTPPPPLLNFRSRGVKYNPLPPRNFLYSFHGLNLPYLEILDRVPLKINCSHLKTQFFMIFDLFVIFYKAICISYAGRARLIDCEQSLFFMCPSSETHKARKQRLISLCHLKKTLRT